MLVVLGVTSSTWQTNIQAISVPEEMKSLHTRFNTVTDAIVEQFQQSQNDLLLLSMYATGVYTNELKPGVPYTSYEGANAVVSPPGITTIFLGIVHNFDWSVWFSLATAGPHLHLTNSSHLDNMWRAMWRAHDRYQAFYVGFVDGYFRRFPWRNLEHYNTLSYQCVTTQLPQIGYDPRCRSWYQISAVAPPNSLAKFSSPFIDASTGKVIISASKAIHADGSLVGVVGATLSVAELEEFLLSETVLQTGYFFLIDSDSNLIIHPRLNRDRVYSAVELEFPPPAEGDGLVLFEDALLALSSNTSEYTIPLKPGDNWVMLTRRAADTGFSLVLLVPEREVFSAATGTVSTVVSHFIGVAIASVVALLVVLLTAVLCVNRSLSKTVSTPIQLMASITSELVEAGGANVDRLANDAFALPEMAEMATKFIQLVRAVEFHQGFAELDPEQSLERLTALEGVLKETGNVVGLGVLYNNMALIHLQLARKNPNSSLPHSLYAVLKAEQALNSAHEQKFEGNALAGRMLTHAMCLAQNGQTEEASRLYSEAADLVADSPDLMAKIVLNESEVTPLSVLIERAQIDQAQCVQVGATHANIEKLQLSCLAVASAARRQGGYDLGLRWASYALGCASMIDSYVTAQLEDIIRAPERKKIHAIFVLDVSGSMAGSRLNQCKASVNEIISDFLEDEDQVSLLRFHNRTKWVFQRKGLTEDMRLTVSRQINHLKAMGGTAFYDAMIETMFWMSEIGSLDHHTVLVALTDGADGHSERSPTHVMEMAAQISGPLIVITVGPLDNIGTITQIVDAAPVGHLIQAQSVQQMKESFHAVGNFISTGNMNLEVL